MAYELASERPVYLAENKSICKMVDAAILVLARVDIESINTLKDRWVKEGLPRALRDESHPFWSAHGQEIFEHISDMIKHHLPDGVYFGTHPEIPEVVGVLAVGDENNIKHAARNTAAEILRNPPREP
ncbi:hypothetical protein Phage2-1_00074 [Achromobacter phage 2-1]|nr:hypothetical protein Phage2-1_00074 [Achromobacter phage 2-1]